MTTAARNEWLAAYCRALAPGARRVLEVGGTGEDLTSFLEGREFHATTTPVGDICRPGIFPDGYFDLIVLKITGREFYDPFAAGDEIARLLAAGGVIIALTSPHPNDCTFSPVMMRQIFWRLQEVAHIASNRSGGIEEQWHIGYAGRKPAIHSGAPTARFRPDLSRFDLTFEQVRAIYERVLDDPACHAAVQTVLSVTQRDLLPELVGDDSRALPSDEHFLSTGYHRMMLGRYLFAGTQFCRGADVLDSCCGLGWGAFLLSSYAKSVTAFDLDARAVEYAAKQWPDRGIRWFQANALAWDFLPDEFFDVVTAMETVEHFTAAEGAAYIASMARRLRTGGVLIGTSAFPATSAEAHEMAATNPHHPHIFTAPEFRDILRRHFRRHTIIGGWMFLALR